MLEAAQRHFELENFVFGPQTNLSSIANQTDGEALEWLIEDMHQRFNMRWPNARDASGRERKLQLKIPDVLTVTDLAEVLDSGAWPENWTSRIGPYLD